MAQAIFVHDGGTIDYTPATNVAAGDVVVQGDLVGVAKLDIPAGQLGALAVEGVFDVPVEEAEGWSVGMTAYWSAYAQAVVPTHAGDAKRMGRVVRLGDMDAEFPRVFVRLSQ
jgi:predicted RecA/RadA family phage recombinase